MSVFRVIAKFRWLFLVVGLILFAYFVFKYINQDKQFLSPVPIENDIKVIQLKGS
ncbi:MAG: hypothetical protein KatS3mg090_0610 [Patescibacteria group bacterium]|nr:MAG: hypothetical protein KatS3mg090_0610 [Patescibacteria group bacterium]